MYPFPLPAVCMCRVSSLLPPAVWTCRVNPFSQPAVCMCSVLCAGCMPFPLPAVWTCRVYPFLNVGISDCPASVQSGTRMNKNCDAGTRAKICLEKCPMIFFFVKRPNLRPPSNIVARAAEFFCRPVYQKPRSNFSSSPQARLYCR
jgi:hypothetical protein